MADDMVTIQCEKCNTRLKIRAVTAKVVKDVKCPKCGSKVLTKPAPAPAAIPQPVPETPAPVATAPVVPAPVAPPAPATQAPQPVATAPAPVAAAPVPPPIAVPAPSPVAPIAPPVVAPPPAPEPVAAPVPPPPPPPPAVQMPAPELIAAWKKIEELEKQLTDQKAIQDELDRSRERAEGLDKQVRQLTVALAEAEAKLAKMSPSEELVKLKEIMKEQEERLGHLQQMWYEKEREARAAYSNAQRAQQDRQFILKQIRTILTQYHDAEIAAATERITKLDARLQEFLTAQATPPPAP